MTISFGTTGTQATHTDTVTTTLVGATGDLAILQVLSGHPNDNVPSTPSGPSRTTVLYSLPARVSDIPRAT